MTTTGTAVAVVPLFIILLIAVLAGRRRRNTVAGRSKHGQPR